jgi:putative tryptophan/tyrosine transport system substrate-binding protein
MIQRRAFVAGIAAVSYEAFRLFKAVADSGPRIAYVTAGAGPSRLTEIFRQSLRNLGYVEGQNITIDYRFTLREEQYPHIFDELLRATKPDIIVTTTPLAAISAKEATATIPVVFLNVGNPVEIGLVRSLSRPGGNLTGLAFNVTGETVGKRLELLKELVPTLSKLGVVWTKDVDAIRRVTEEVVSRVGAALRLSIQTFELAMPSEVEAVFGRIKISGVQAISIQPSGLSWIHRERFVKAANSQQLPAVYAMEDFVEVGGLMAYGLDRQEPYQRAAVLVDKILRGTPPAEIPIEQPNKHKLTINLKTARALNLTIPPSLLLRADQVIE